MIDYQFAENIYLAPTPAGAFYALSSPTDDPIRRLLLALLNQTETPRPVTGQLIDWSGTNNVETMLTILNQAQSLSWIEGLEKPLQLPKSNFAETAEILLVNISSSGKAILVEDMGGIVAQSGFDAETSEILSAISMDLVAIQDRHEKHLKKHFGLTIHGWGAMDSSGASRIATWPLYFGSKRLLLILLGEPRFNSPEFTLLAWSLVQRYYNLT